MTDNVIPISDYITPGAVFSKQRLYLRYEFLFGLGTGSARRRIISAISICRQTDIVEIVISMPEMNSKDEATGSVDRDHKRLSDTIRQAFALLGERPPPLRQDKVDERYMFKVLSSA